MLEPSRLARLFVPAVCLTLAACVASEQTRTTDQPRASVASAVAEVSARQNLFPTYPRPGTTYLSFNKAHGFQVNYIAEGGRAWLWFPGNSAVVREDWKLDKIRGTSAICFRHPKDSRNPVTKRSGGAFQCQALDLSQKTIISSLPGDPFNLRSGDVPYRLSRCEAPSAFSFDRKRFAC